MYCGFFDILLSCYFNLSSLIIPCLSFGDAYLFLDIYLLGIPLSCSIDTISKLVCCNFLKLLSFY